MKIIVLRLGIDITRLAISTLKLIQVTYSTFVCLIVINIAKLNELENAVIESLSDEKQTAVAYFNLGQFYRKIGQFKTACTYFEK